MKIHKLRNSEEITYIKRLIQDRSSTKIFDYTVNITPASAGEGKLSATDMREAIADNDFESFLNFIPEESLDKADQIWTQIFGRRETSQLSEAKKRSGAQQ